MTDQDPTIVESTTPETNPWDALAKHDELRRGLDGYALENFGVGVKDATEDLTPPMIPDENGELQPFKGRPFDTSRSVEMPVRRPSGHIEPWVALGMDIKSVLNPDTGKTEEVYTIIVTGIDSETGKTLVKEVRADDQVELLRRLARQDEQMVDTDSILPEAQASVVSPEIDPSSPEAMLAGLADNDRKALMSFAFHAANKRSAQLGGYDGEPRYHTEQMGALLKSMSPGARAIARQYASKRFGDDKVAF